MGLKLNVSMENLPSSFLLPALRKPTVSSAWRILGSRETVIDEKLVRDPIYKLKEAGAEDYRIPFK